MNKTITAILSIIAMFIVGCDKPHSNNVNELTTNSVIVSSSKITLDANKMTNIVLKIGSMPVTYQQCDEQCRLLIAFKENKQNRKFDARQWTNEYRLAMRRIPNFFWYKYSILSEATKSNFVFSAVSDDFRKTYLKNVRKPRQSIDKLIASVGPLSNAVTRIMEDDYRIMSFIKTTFSNELTVTTNDVLAAKKRIEDYNDAAYATNELALAKSVVITNAIANGLAIKDAISKYAEDTWNDDKFDVLTIDATDFLNEYDWTLFKNSDKCVPTKAFEIEDGYAIYYKISDEDADTFEAYRIFLRRAEIVDEMNDDEIILELTDSKRETVMKKFLTIAFSNNALEFPYGKNNFLKMFGL